MKLFFAYLRQRRRDIFVFFLFCGVFCLCFFLCRLPVRAAVYPALLCALLGAAFVSYDFLRVRKRHKNLLEIRELTAAMISALPEPETVESADYQKIIRNLQRETVETETAFSARYRDMTEYYTLWAHQIKTPITSMRLTLEKEDTAVSRKLTSDLFQIEQYVDMVLAFMRMDSDFSDFLFRKQNVDEIIKQTAAKFSAEFIDRGLRLNYTPTGLTAVTDGKWLSFVMEQLLSNALKYTREGEIRIYADGAYTLCMEDTGIGIDPADLPRVFEKGYTGCNGRSDRRASGIGLYLCKRICDKLGIGISITSELNKGTVVRLNLKQYNLRAE